MALPLAVHHGDVQMVMPEVATATSQTKRASDVILRGGVLDAVTPVGMSAPTIPRGRMFARCLLLDASGAQMHCVWQGYLVSAGSTVLGPSSVPNITVEPGWQMQAEVTQTGQGAATNVTFHCHVAPAGVSSRAGSFIFTEEPGVGVGELRAVSLGNPAAGAEYSTQTVPAKCRWVVRSIRGRLSTDATVANRVTEVNVDDGTNAYAIWTWPLPVTASSSPRLTLATGAGDTANAAVSAYCILGGIAALPLAAGHRVSFSTNNLQAGDNWDAGFMFVEEWAVP